MTETSSARASAKAIDESLIEEIVRRILRVSSPDRIIMFGSSVTGEMTRDSDIDLLIVHPGFSSADNEWVRIRESLRGMGYPFDLILMNTERFEDTKNVIGGIAYPANKHGRVIYEGA